MLQPKYMTHKPKPIWFSVPNPSSFPNFPLHSSAPLLRRRRRKFRLVESDPKMSISYSPCFQPLKVFSRSNLVRSTGALTLKRCNVVTCMKKSYEDTSLEAKVDFLLDHVKWDDKGLAVAIAQNVDTGAVLMQGFANREALSTTISSHKATFYSRSRSSLWTKGETSNNFINVFDVFLDCDRDSIIYLGKPDGPTCHTGSETCYYTPVDELLKNPEVEKNELALTTLYALESTINQRKAETSSSSNGKPSWTKRLLLDDKLLCSKIREEADELCRTLEQNEANGRTASEMADVLYHAMVLLSLRGVQLEEVMQVLRQRFSKSGIEEKNSRKS